MSSYHRTCSFTQDNNNSTTAATAALDQKAEEINLLLSEPEIDLWKLREYALSEGGLVNDSIRQRAWPALVGLQPPESPSVKRKNKQQSAPPSNLNNNNTQQQSAQQQSNTASAAVPVDVRQIEFDVTRCTWHLLTGNQRTQRLQMEHKRHKKVARVIKKKQHRLASLIHSTLVTSSSSSSSSSCSPSNSNVVTNSNNNHWRSLQSPENNGKQQEQEQQLHYYQGYHDVACIFLSTLAGNNRLKTWNSTSTTSDIAANESNARNTRLQQPVQLVRRDSMDSQSTASTNHSHAASMASNTADDDGNNNVNRATTPFVFNTALPMSPGLHLPAACLLQVSQSHFRDCMRASFGQLQTTLKLTVFPLIALLDPEVHDHLVACDMAPFFALPWVITWFSHEIRDTALVKRLFDAFVVSHPLLPIYVAVAMVLHPTNRLQILDTECDFASLHHALLELPKNSSMVGWKYQPGDGYVSDQEEDGDADNMTDKKSDDGGASLTTSTTADSSNLDVDVDGDLLLFQAGLLDQDIKKNKPTSVDCLGAGSVSGGTGGGNDVVSLSSMSSFMGASSSNAALVPFQDLLDTALGTYMRQMPPRRLLALSKRYYGKDQVEALLQQAAGGAGAEHNTGDAVPITLFDNAPSWSIAPTAQADWLLKQQARERGGSSATSRRDRRKRAQYHQRALSSSSLDPTSTSSSGPTAKTTTTTPVVVAKAPGTIARILKEKKYTMAVIATGYGPSHDEERRLRKRRKVLRTARRVALAVVVSTVLYWASGMALFMPTTTPTTTQRSSWSWTTRTMVLTTIVAMALGTKEIMGKRKKRNPFAKLWKTQ